MGLAAEARSYSERRSRTATARAEASGSSGSALNNLRLARARGRPASTSASLYTRALGIREKLLGPDHHLAWTLRTWAAPPRARRARAGRGPARQVARHRRGARRGASLAGDSLLLRAKVSPRRGAIRRRPSRTRSARRPAARRALGPTARYLSEREALSQRGEGRTAPGTPRAAVGAGHGLACAWHRGSPLPRGAPGTRSSARALVLDELASRRRALGVAGPRVVRRFEGSPRPGEARARFSVEEAPQARRSGRRGSRGPWRDKDEAERSLGEATPSPRREDPALAGYEHVARSLSAGGARRAVAAPRPTERRRLRGGLRGVRPGPGSSDPALMARRRPRSTTRGPLARRALAEGPCRAGRCVRAGRPGRGRAFAAPPVDPIRASSARPT